MASRLLSVLAVFGETRPSLTLKEIADGSGLAPATAHCLIAELVEWGALVRTDSGRYVVGRRLWQLGMPAPDQSDLRAVASPFLHDIYGATLATVHLAIRDGDKVRYLDRLVGHASVPAASRIGARLPLHATGVGKVLLAHAPGGGSGAGPGFARPAHAVHHHSNGQARRRSGASTDVHPQL